MNQFIFFKKAMELKIHGFTFLKNIFTHDALRMIYRNVNSCFDVFIFFYWNLIYC